MSNKIKSTVKKIFKSDEKLERVPEKRMNDQVKYGGSRIPLGSQHIR